MSYYIDQLAERERQMRLSDFLAFQEKGGDERSLGNYPAPPGMQGYDYGPPVMEDSPPDDMLPPTQRLQFLEALADPNNTIRSQGFQENFMGGTPYMPPQQQPMPQNYIRNEKTGAVTDLGKSQQIPIGDYGQVPVDTPYGRGHYLKGDNTRVVLSDGRVVDLGRDTGRERVAEKEKLALQKLRQEVIAGRESTLQKEIAKLLAQEAAAKQPGTMAYKRIQDEEIAKRKEAAKVSSNKLAAENAKKYSESVANEVDVAIASLFNTTPDKLPGLFNSIEGMKKAEGETESATGSIDVLLPTLMTSTANVEERAKRLQSMAELMGLTNLRKSGVAPGSITEKEWPKFGAQLGNLSLRMGDKEFVDEMARIWKKNQDLRNTGQMDLDDAIKGSSDNSGSPNEVRLPNGKTKIFSSPAAANAFKKAAGLQ